MKTIIAGSRSITDPRILRRAVKESGFTISEVVSGKARGVDTMAVNWAWQVNLPVKIFPADWKKHGRAAGVFRNVEMAEHAEALIAIWDGISRGTKHMIDEAKKRGLQVFVYSTKDFS